MEHSGRISALWIHSQTHNSWNKMHEKRIFAVWPLVFDRSPLPNYWSHVKSKGTSGKLRSRSSRWYLWFLHKTSSLGAAIDQRQVVKRWKFVFHPMLFWTWGAFRGLKFDQSAQFWCSLGPGGGIWLWPCVSQCFLINLGSLRWSDLSFSEKSHF